MTAFARKNWPLIISSGLFVCFNFSGCALAELGEMGAVGEAAAVGSEAAVIGGEALVVEEAALLGRAALAGDAAALSRLGAVEGAALGETAIATLSRAAAARAVAGLGVSTPLVEEVAIIRAGGRVLAYPESYPVARLHDLTVKMPNGSLVGSIRRFGERAVIRNRGGQVVGESIATTERFSHYADSAHGTLRGYSTFDGTRLRHWIVDDNGNSVYLGSEVVRPRSGIPPDSITVPSAFLAAPHEHGSERKPGAAVPRGATHLADSPASAANYFLTVLQAGDITEAYNCLSEKMEHSLQRGGIVYAILTEAEPPSVLKKFQLKNLIDQTYGEGKRFRITAIIEGNARQRILLYIQREDGLWKIKNILDATGEVDWVIKNNNLHPEE